MRLSTLLFLTAFAVGCSSNDDDTPSENMVGTVDTVLDRTWLLTTVQDSSGNQTQVVQEAGFEFTIRLSSSFVEPGGDVMQEVMSVGGINVCNFYSGGYTLDNGLLTLISVSEDTGSCGRTSELPATLFSTVLFTSGGSSMLAIDTDTDVLTISSGTNESLLFQAQQE